MSIEILKIVVSAIAATWVGVVAWRLLNPNGTPNEQS